MTQRPPRSLVTRATGRGLALLVTFGLSGCDGESKPSLAEAMKKADEEVEVKRDGPPKPPPSSELPPPTEAEIKAWDRKDPEGEKHLYKWDKRNMPRMWNYWMEMHCFKDKIKEAGSKAFGAEPQSPEDEKWYQFKRVFIPFLDVWQQRLFANEPRILEKSKFIGHFLEAHELIMNGYPKAYNESDENELMKQEAHWLLVEDKVVRYVEQLGGGKKYKIPNLENPKEAKAYAKFCEKAMNPKKQKGPKKVREKTPI